MNTTTQKVTAMYQQLANANAEEWERIFTNYSKHNQGARFRDMGTSDVIADPVIYESRGASIEWIKIFDHNGTESNRISFGHGFQLVIGYRSDQDFQNLGFGCHLADPSGRRYTGQVFPVDGKETGPFNAGCNWAIRFSFRSGLLPGLYYIGAGIWSEQSEHSYVHRVVDMVNLRIESTDNVPRIGTCDLQDSPPELQT